MLLGILLLKIQSISLETKAWEDKQTCFQRKHSRILNMLFYPGHEVLNVFGSAQLNRFGTLLIGPQISHSAIHSACEKIERTTFSMHTLVLRS